MPTTSFSDWNFHNYHVVQDVQGGQFVSAESTLVAAGPPQLVDAGVSQIAAGSTQAVPGTTTPGKNAATANTSTVFPIGLLENASLQQNRQLQRIFEIGSSRSYFVPGRTIGAMTLGRTFYFGPSLMRALYAFYKDDGSLGSDAIGTVAAGSTAVDATSGFTYPDPQAALVGQTWSPKKLRNSPGAGFFFINLASDLFAQPTGMAVYFKDTNYLSVGAFYLQFCYIQGHQMSISAGSILIVEGVSMQYDNMIPIKVL